MSLLDHLLSEEIPRLFPSSVGNLVSISGSTAPLEVSGCHRARSSGRRHSRRSALPGCGANPCQTLLTWLTYGDVNIHTLSYSLIHAFTSTHVSTKGHCQAHTEPSCATSVSPQCVRRTVCPNCVWICVLRQRPPAHTHAGCLHVPQAHG